MFQHLDLGQQACRLHQPSRLTTVQPRGLQGLVVNRLLCCFITSLSLTPSFFLFFFGRRPSIITSRLWPSSVNRSPGADTNRGGK